MMFLIAGLALFLGVHSVEIFLPQVKSLAVTRIGTNAWKGIFSLVAIAGFVLICIGYGEARLSSPVWLYQPPKALRQAAFLLMLPVFPLLLAAYLPGRIRTRAKHPMLLATKLWALAHLLANGGLHDTLLFGSFLIWAVADRISVKHRTVVSSPPPSAPASRWNDLVVLLGGLTLYLLFVAVFHKLLIGVSPNVG